MLMFPWVCTCVYMYVYASLCMYAFPCVSMHICVCIYFYTCLFVSMCMPFLFKPSHPFPQSSMTWRNLEYSSSEFIPSPTETGHSRGFFSPQREFLWLPVSSRRNIWGQVMRPTVNQCGKLYYKLPYPSWGPFGTKNPQSFWEGRQHMF